MSNKLTFGVFLTQRNHMTTADLLIFDLLCNVIFYLMFYSNVISERKLTVADTKFAKVH